MDGAEILSGFILHGCVGYEPGIGSDDYYDEEADEEEDEAEDVLINADTRRGHDDKEEEADRRHSWA
jgi:hypothetical protein